MKLFRSLIDKITGKGGGDPIEWVADARKALGLNQIGKAKEILGKGLAGFPGCEEGWLLLGEAVGQADVETRISTYRAALQACSGSAELNFKLGCAMQDAGRIDDAMASYEKAAELKAGFARAQNNLGCLFLFRGDKRKAEACFRQAVCSDHSLSNAYFNLAAIHIERGEYEDAFAHLKKALENDPGNDETLASLVGILAEHKKLDEIEALMRGALADAPESYGLLNNLGRVLRLRGRNEEAITLFSRAHKVEPSFPSALVNLGQTYYEMGQYEQSAGVLEKALRVDLHSKDALLAHGCCLYMLGRTDEAVQTFKMLTALHPDSASTFINLGAALVKLDQYDEAEECFRKAVELDPENSSGYGNLGLLLQQQSEHDEAIRCYQRALELSPNSALTHSNYLLALNYFRGEEAESVFLEHRKWAKSHANALAVEEVFANEPSIARKLRVGYISPDFRRHSVAYFMEPVLERHDKSLFEVFCYSDVLREDAVTLRLKQHADEWIQIAGMSDGAVAEQIRKDRIDILVDLSGHTADNRLLVFARRAAPIQVSYLGYPNTTGLGGMDYRLSDSVADPPGKTDQFHAEKLWRLPNTFLCYRPSAECPDVALRCAGKEPEVTFASFNNYSKVTTEIVELWAKILRAVPGSRMVIKSIGLGSRATQRKLLERFASLGVTSDRISVHGVDPGFAQHIARYADVDIALDTFPYSGTTTSCEALWMGVPVVTRAGRAHVSRVTASLLTAIGLPELVAETDSAYVDKAVSLARDALRLRELRKLMRPRMAASPLMDETVFVHGLEAAYGAMWQKWCEQAKGQAAASD